MDVKKLKEYLEDIPDDYVIELGTFMSANKDNSNLEDYVIIFDLPIIGIAKSDNDKHCRFISKGDKEDFVNYGATIINFEESIN